MEHARIVVTGMDVYTPLATNKETYFQRSCNGDSEIRDVRDLIPIKYETEPGKFIPMLETCGVQRGSLFYPPQLVDENFGRDARKKMSHDTKIAFAAAKGAVEDSGIFYNDSTAEQVRMRTGVSIGSGFGGLSDIEKDIVNSTKYNDSQWREECVRRGRKRDSEKRGLQRVDEFTALKTLPGAPSAYVSGYYQLHCGGGVSGSAECGTGLANIIMGCKDIQLGNADVYICGGTGDALSFLTFAGFDILSALSPTGVSRPFDRDRNGFIIGDGAGVVVIERLEHAVARGAKIYGEILGYGERLDGVYSTGTREDGKFATLAIQEAIQMAGLNPCDIDHVNAHGTSTLLNDWQETLAIKQALGEHAKEISITAGKSKTGHMLNATAAIEFIEALQTINAGVIPPTINYDPLNRDTDVNYHKESLRKYFVPCDLDYVPNQAREAKVKTVLKTSFAFGGRSFAIVVRK